MILPTPLQKLVGNECKIGQNSNPWNNMLIFSSDMSREFLTYILSHIYLYLPHKNLSEPVYLSNFLTHPECDFL